MSSRRSTLSIAPTSCSTAWSRCQEPSSSSCSTKRWPRSISGQRSPRACERASRPRRTAPGVSAGSAGGLMKTGLHQSTQLRQELKINPRLYQAMDLLYMPLLDLQQHLKQELETNPFLELVEPEDEEETEEEAAASAETEEPKEDEAKGEIDWEEILLEGFDAGGQREEHEDKEYYEPTASVARDLGDHLMEQIALLDLSPREAMLAEEFVGNINDEGYLSCTVQDIVDGINAEVEKAADASGAAHDTPLPLYTMAEAEQMLGRIQDLEPP